MKGINFLPRQVFLLTQYSFNSSISALHISLLNANINNFKNFGTSRSILRGKGNFEGKSKDNTVEKGREIKTSIVNVSQSSEKKKTLQKTKSLTVRPEITPNDLQIKINQIQKFINKGISVAVKINNTKNPEEGGFEEIFSQIQKLISELQISARITKSGPTVMIYPISTNVKADKIFKEEEGNSFSGFNSESEGKS